MTWLMTVVAGLALGLCLYGVVRLRNACLPWARNRFGQAGYWACWVAALALMLLAANLGILLVRGLIHLSVSPVSPLPLEVSFALIALATGGFLALRHARHCRSDNSTH